MEMNQYRNRDKDDMEKKFENKPLPSRAEYHRKKRKAKEGKDNNNRIKISIPLVLLLVLLMLPIGILSIINSGQSPKANPVSNSGEEVSFVTEDILDETESEPAEIENDESGTDSAGLPDKKDKENKAVKKQAKKDEEKENQTSEPVKNNEDPPAVSPQPNNENLDQNSEEKVVYHTVQQGENLFRISMKYFSSQEGVEKIKQANGLGSNEISVGQTLKIPLP